VRANFPHTALGGSIKLSRVTPSATSEHFPGLLGSSPILLSSSLAAFTPNRGPFPPPELPGFIGTTRLSATPDSRGLTLASCRLITQSPNGASRVASGPLCVHAIASTPARSMEPIRSYRPIDCGLPLKTGGSALALLVSRPAQRSLSLCPARLPSRHRDPLHRRLQRLRYLCRCFDCYRVERTSSRAGLSPAVDRRLFTAHSFRQVTVNLGIVSNPVLAFPGSLADSSRGSVGLADYPSM
jgi:hypothetical protein